jgi:hypothetical protein
MRYLEPINPMEWYRKTKWFIQRGRYGYDETIKWEFDTYFRYFIKPLREFCNEWLEDVEIAQLNKRKANVMVKTLKLINEYEKMTLEESWGNNNAENKLWEYFGKNISIYWD